MLNIATITGRLVKDPQIRQAGKTDNIVLDFTLAVQEDRKDKEGNYLAQFIDVQAWNQAADFLAQYAHKGDVLTASGRIIRDVWKNEDGTYNARVYVRADHVYIVSQKDADETEKKPRRKYGK